MFAQERWQTIQQLLARKGRFLVADLQKALGVSPATLRRDLAEMEKAGLVLRVHGGVVHPSSLRGEPTLVQKGTQAIAAKRAIARAAADLVPESTTVLIDSGTTCLEIGRLLLMRKDLTILTNSVPLLHLALQFGSAALIAIGGELRAVSGALTGSIAFAWAESLHAQMAFIAASGLSMEHGISTTELAEATIKRQFISHSTKRILVADSTKWNVPATANFAEWNQFHTWITDYFPSRSEKTTLTSHKLQILQVKSHEAQ